MGSDDQELSGAELFDHVDRELPCIGVQSGKRLIHENDLRRCEDRAQDRDTPLHAAGKFTDRLIQGVFREKTEQVFGQSFVGISLSKSEAEVFNGGISFQKTVFLKNSGDQGTHPTDPAGIRF